VAEKLILKELSRYGLGTYADVMYRNALLYPAAEAFVYDDRRITFSEYNSRVNSLIHALRAAGLKKGDGIGIVSWNCLEVTDITGAAMKGGFVVSPFNPRMQPDELVAIVNYSEAKALFVGKELVETIDRLRPRLPAVEHFVSLECRAPGMTEYGELLRTFSVDEPDVQVSEDDPFIIFYTSGTTGAPRGAVYTHLKRTQEAQTKAFGMGLSSGCTNVMVLPLFHIGGWSYFWTFFYVGARNVIISKRFFDAEATLKAVQDEKATDIQIVPTQLVAMLGLESIDSLNLSKLQRILYAASPMPVELLRRGMARFGPIFTQLYGQSESGPDIAFLSKEAHQVLDKSAEEQKVLASCGLPHLGVHARIVNDANEDVEPGVVGEIVVQSKSMMAGYWRKPEDTASVMAGGWLHTGDMGYYDEKGFMYLVDRRKDMIITGGENVFPREVEEVLYGHPAVSEAAVVGVPDDVWVERVHAEVVLREGQAATTADLIDYCKDRLARYKAPKSMEIVKALPKNPQGKILKREIRQKYWQGKDRKI
jgi:acyl-CoA synthetase (AMP-forming)/AMP-acid ligase II